MRILDDLQRLTPSQGVLLYRLVDLNYLTKEQVDGLINQLVSDRFVKAMDYLTFAQQLDASMTLNQPHIIFRCYYAMYHAARALVLHVRRADLDDHDRLPAALGQVLGTDYGDVLGRWREMRNQTDYSPYAPTDLASQVVTAVSDANLLLTTCRDYLQNRGVSL
jgi:uncharacterized protein (UPF0332 family)